MNDLLGVKPSFSINPAEYVDLKKDIEMGHSPHPAHDADEKKTKKKKRRKKTKKTKPNQTMDHSLTLFFGEVDTVKTEMQKVRELLARLQASHEETKKAHRAGAMKEIRERMEEDVGEVLRKVKSIKSKLEEMDKSSSNQEEEDHSYGCSATTTTAMDRTRCSITASLRKKLKDLMQEFQDLREKVMWEHREAVKRRIYAVTGSAMDEASVDRMINAGESENFLQRAIQEQGKGRAIESVVIEIQERHDAVKDMACSLLELHQLFLDMSVLVESQGEQLDCIQHHVSMANVYVDRGAGQLMAAKKSQSRNRKWVVGSIIILLILIAIILIPVLKSFKTS